MSFNQSLTYRVPHNAIREQEMQLQKKEVLCSVHNNNHHRFTAIIQVNLR